MSIKSPPFSSIDFFGYLISGLIATIVIDYTFQLKIVLDPKMPAHYFLPWMLIAYFFGHVIAMPASKLLEKFVVWKIMGKPSMFLLQEKRKGILPKMFPEFYRPLPKSVRDQILKSGSEKDIKRPSEDLFYVAFSLSYSIDDAAKRLTGFLNMYSFSRNLCLTLLLAATFTLYPATPADTPLIITAVGFALSYIMFLRYLKFYRLYSKEVYLIYMQHLKAMREGN